MDGNISLSEIMKGGLAESNEEALEQEESVQEEVDQEDVQEESEVVEEEATEEAEQEETVNVNPEVEKATADGWVPKDEWVERGGDPDDWVSAKKFNERGNMIGQIKSLQKRLDEDSKSFEDRLDKVNKFHEAQLKAKITELQSQRREAIEQADVDAVEEFDAQIEELKAGDTSNEPKQEQPKNESGFTDSDMTLINGWNSENEWVNNIDDPRTPYAQSRFNIHLGSGKSVEEAISLVNTDLSKAFPKTNPNREIAPRVETNQSKPKQKVVKKLQWSDLTREEENMYKSMPTAFGSKKDFLQTVEDIRKEG